MQDVFSWVSVSYECLCECVLYALPHQLACNNGGVRESGLLRDGRVCLVFVPSAQRHMIIDDGDDGGMCWKGASFTLGAVQSYRRSVAKWWG